MIKNRFIFILLSALYILFVSKADLYSKIILNTNSPICCSEEIDENSCCGNELNDGKCQSNSCCHITSTSIPTSISVSESKIDISAKQDVQIIHVTYSDFFRLSFFNFSKTIGSSCFDLNQITSIFQHYLAFINTWKC